jgi:PIN domain nuclease of toxin-antitoxin system
MRYLLDTCTLLWCADGSDEVSKTVKEITNDKNSQLYVGVVSMWEFAIKHSKKKLPFEGGLSRLYEIMKQAGFIIMPIMQSHLAAFIDLPPMEKHKDPFDRLLVATAKAENMTILTADENIHKYDVSFVW